LTAETLLDTCQRLLDQDAEPLRHHDGHDGTHALRAGTTSGEIIVKRHRTPQKHTQELHAYQHWTTSLGGHAPRLLASCDDPPTIIITVLPGQPLKDQSLRAEAELRAHRNAGELLAKYHQAAPARADLNMVEWLADRGDQWLAVARTIIPTSQQRTIRTHLHALAALGHIDAVPCHLDYTLRNLLATDDGSASVIDFEHSRYDLAARDLVRFATRTWTNRPHLQDAFLVGYGALTELDWAVIEHCSHLDSLTRLARAHRLELKDPRTRAVYITRNT
jgi:tRNA A-37 threonylcarbamoyl transferase component Bud32